MNFFLYFVLVQYLIIVIYILAIVFSKISVDIHEKREIKRADEIKIFLKDVLSGNVEFKELNFKKKWKATSLLIVLEDFDKSFSSDLWEKVKGFFSEEVLLPWARRHTKSFTWLKKNFAARMFYLFPKLEDINYLRSLLQGPSFFNRMITVEALARIEVFEAIEMILFSMAGVPLQSRFPFRHALLKMSFASRKHILSIYQKAENEKIREVCLDVLSYGYLPHLKEAIERDFSTNNIQIKLSILKILENLNDSDSLMSFLEDQNQRIRLKAIETLSELRSEKAFARIASLLNDDSYEIRLASAFGLVKYGNEGRKILELQDWDINPKAYEIARYVLNLT